MDENLDVPESTGKDAIRTQIVIAHAFCRMAEEQVCLGNMGSAIESVISVRRKIAEAARLLSKGGLAPCAARELSLMLADLQDRATKLDRSLSRPA